MASHSKSVSAVNVRTFERPRNADGTLARVPDFFGSNVFDLQAMGKRLTANDIDCISKVMKFGGKIDAALAERVASAAREWSVEKGATHYCHWFQPQTGSTAEKHDAFLWFGKSGEPVERFTGRELLQSEPDASSFPSGGIRSTFEARGYTGWDPSSPMFVMETENGRTLYIPSVFVSYHGEALDHKVPLLRSNEALSLEATKTLHILGEKQVTGVYPNVGPEQEFFLVDKEVAKKRPDLSLSGRTVFGRKPAKGQELEDHYFASIPSRVHAFFNELEIELYKVGVPIKTRHNEVAPGQFEIAPIFEPANVAADHNQLAMKIMNTVGGRHGFKVLFHEKPFAGVNGSGKHVNWSLSDSTGRNLLDPGNTPHQNIVFLTFLAGVLQGIYDNADVIRSSIAFAGNDHRLGANEAPPAIISAFLGDNLDKIVTAIEKGHNSNVNAEKLMIDLGVCHLQELAKDNTDRNRTSPFAFTGNKFEFRAVGSTQPVNYPTAILNAAATDGLRKVNALLNAKAKNGLVSPEATLEVLREVFIATNKIRFEGNGYSSEWRDEAKARGLSNFATTPQALAVLRDASKTQFLVDAKVFKAEDMESRLAVQLERYIKQRLIELNCAIDMAQSGILPAAMTHLQNTLTTARDASALNIVTPANRIAAELGGVMNRLDVSLLGLKKAVEKASSGDAFEHHHLMKTAEIICDNLMPKLEELREAVDEIEALLPDSLWPFPKYSEMLFGIE